MEPTLESTTDPITASTIEPINLTTSAAIEFVYSEDFNYSLNGWWSAYNDSADRDAYIFMNDSTDSTPKYLYYHQTDSVWVMSIAFGSTNWSDIWYYCSQWTLSDCIASQWMGWTDGYWYWASHYWDYREMGHYTDSNAVITIHEDTECPTTSPTASTMKPTLSPTPNDTICAVTKHFIDGLDREWIEYNDSNPLSKSSGSDETNRFTFRTAFNGSNLGMFHLFWNSNELQWIISQHIDSDDALIWYFCDEDMLSNCTNGTWYSHSNDTESYVVDSDATVTLLRNQNCTEISEMLVTNSPTGLPTSFPTNEPTANLTESPTDCTRFVETLHFEDENMDGIWMYQEEGEYFRLNISDSTGYYKMNFSAPRWIVVEVDDNGDSSDIIMFCAADVDLAEFAGQWFVYDDKFGYGWYPHSEATSQLVECALKECDVTGYTVNDTIC